MLLVVTEMVEAFVPRILPFSQAFLDGAGTKVTEVLRLVVVVDLVALTQMRLMEHAIVRDVVVNHRPAVDLAESGLLVDPILSCVVAVDIMSLPFLLFTECLVAVFIDVEVGMGEIWR